MFLRIIKNKSSWTTTAGPRCSVCRWRFARPKWAWPSLPCPRPKWSRGVRPDRSRTFLPPQAQMGSRVASRNWKPPPTPPGGGRRAGRAPGIPFHSHPSPTAAERPSPLAIKNEGLAAASAAHSHYASPLPSLHAARVTESDAARARAREERTKGKRGGTAQDHR